MTSRSKVYIAKSAADCAVMHARLAHCRSSEQACTPACNEAVRQQAVIKIVTEHLPATKRTIMKLTTASMKSMVWFNYYMTWPDTPELSRPMLGQSAVTSRRTEGLKFASIHCQGPSFSKPIDFSHRLRACLSRSADTNCKSRRQFRTGTQVPQAGGRHAKQPQHATALLMVGNHLQTGQCTRRHWAVLNH